MPGADDVAVMSIAAQRRARARRRARQHEALLHSVALALSSTLELKEVLHELAELTLEVTGADRCSIFLLEGSELKPAVAIGVHPDEDLWSLFRALGPLDVGQLPEAKELLADHRAVFVPDARLVPFIPTEWVETFALRSVVVVPLLAEGHTCGILALDYQERHDPSADELQMLEAIGAYAGLAVRNARLFEITRRRAALQQALARSAAALASPLEPAAIAAHLVAACAEMLDASPCAIALFTASSDHLTLLAPPTPARTTIAVPARISAALSAQWSIQPRPARFGADPWFVEFGKPADQHFVLPLVANGEIRGVLVLGFAAAKAPDKEQYQAAEALASIASAALERAGLLRRLERQVRRLEGLYNLSGALSSPATLTAKLGELLEPDGITVYAVTMRSRHLARKLGWELTSGTLPGPLAIPLRLGRSAVGYLHVGPAGLDQDDVSYLETIGRSVADMAARTATRIDLEEAAQARAVAAERERMAADLHDTVGQLFVALNLLAHRSADELPAGSPWVDKILRLADIAKDGKWAIDQAVRALAFVPAARAGLASSLRGLARSVESDSGITVAVTITGRALPLPSLTAQALYRVAHEAVANAWRHASCSLITISLDYADAATTLRVRDDGVGLELRGDERHVGVGMTSMRKAMAEVGGTLRVMNAPPRGVVVEGVAPRPSAHPRALAPVGSESR